MRTFDKRLLELGECVRCNAFTHLIPNGEDRLCTTCASYFPCKGCGIYQHRDDYRWWCPPFYGEQVADLDFEVTKTCLDIYLVSQICNNCL